MDLHSISTLPTSTPPTSTLRIGRTLLLGAALAAVVGVIGVRASHAADSSSTRLSLAELDLATPEGLAIARERVHQSARRVCSRIADDFDLGHQPHFVACVERSMAVALPQVERLAAQARARASSVQAENRLSR